MTRTGTGTLGIFSALSLAFLTGASFAFAADPAKPAEKAPAPAPAKPVPPAPAAAPAKPTAVAPAKAPAPAPAVANAQPAPSPELDVLFKGFEGNWKCATTMAPGSLGANSPETKLQASVRVAK